MVKAIWKECQHRGDICADPVYKESGFQAVSYQPGKEQELFHFFHNIYTQLNHREDTEDYETALQRKLNLDRSINDGKVFISQGKFSEADSCFANAFKFYKNEFAAYAIMAKSMMEAGQYVRALGYIKKGLSERPKDQNLLRLADECASKRD